jgi:sortase A
MSVVRRCDLGDGAGYPIRVSSPDDGSGSRRRRALRAFVAIAGHRTTYGAPFRKIDKVRKGDDITVTMPYGRFTYRVERTRIVAPTAVWVTQRVSYDRLILSACHPLYSAAKRIVVFARLIRSAPRGAAA